MLKRPEPPSHITASRQLTEAKIEFKRIVAVSPEAILFTLEDEQGRERAWTAWSEVRDQAGTKVVFYRQTGFPAFPSPYLKDTG